MAREVLKPSDKLRHLSEENHRLKDVLQKKR